MNMKRPQSYLLGPTDDPIRNELSLYFLVRFKQKLLKLSVVNYNKFCDLVNSLALCCARRLVNILELQFVQGLDVTGEVDEAVVAMLKTISGKKRDSSIEKILDSDQYSFREILLKHELEQRTKKPSGGRIKIWQRI